jgi:predicted PurR-regulated permease PerM
MTFAAEWNFGDFMLAVLWVALLFIWFWLLVRVFADLFRRHDISGWAKALWVIFVIVVPYFGVFVYVITQAGSMAAAAGSAEELGTLTRLHDSGQLSDAEYQQLRNEVTAD